MIFAGGTGRDIISSTTGRDATAFCFDGTGRYIFVFTTGRDGTHIFSLHRRAQCKTHCSRHQGSMLQCYKLKLLVRRIISSYDIIRAFSMGINLLFLQSVFVYIYEGKIESRKQFQILREE